MSVDDWRDVLNILATPKLNMEQAYDISNMLCSMVKDEEKLATLDLLEQANVIALSIWKTTETDEHDEAITDWLQCAINHPGGVIVEFWIKSLSLLMRGKSGANRVIPDNYKQWFTWVVQDQTIKGGLGRSVLASQMVYLFGLDEVWTRDKIITLFSDTDREKFSQAWDGFLTWGRLTPALADDLLPAFTSSILRLDSDMQNHRKRFIEFYTALSVFYVDDPTR